MTPLSVVMICMNTYRAFTQGVSNRNWQVLQEFLKRQDIDRVLAVDFPPVYCKQQLRFFLKDSKISGKIIKRGYPWKLTQINNKLFVLSTLTKSRHEVKITKQIKQCLWALNFKDFILWSYVPLLSDCFGKLGEKNSVFETVDNWLLHQSYKNKPRIKNQLERNYQIISQKADFIFTVAKDLLTLFPDHQKKYWIPNGVNLDHFIKHGPIPKSLNDLKRPIIGYVGTIENRVDFKIINALAEKFKTGSLVMIGPNWSKYRYKKKYANLHYFGPVSYADLPSYLAAFDVAIIPHLENEFTRTMNPLKLYDYLAAGKPVVTTPVAGVEQFHEQIRIARSSEEFCREVSNSLGLNTQELISKRREAVRPLSWKNKIDQMFSYLT